MFFITMLVVTGLALVVTGIWVLAYRPPLVRAILIVSGVAGLSRAAFLLRKRRVALAARSKS